MSIYFVSLHLKQLFIQSFHSSRVALVGTKDGQLNLSFRKEQLYLFGVYGLFFSLLRFNQICGSVSQNFYSTLINQWILILNAKSLNNSATQQSIPVSIFELSRIESINTLMCLLWQCVLIATSIAFETTSRDTTVNCDEAVDSEVMRYYNQILTRNHHLVMLAMQPQSFLKAQQRCCLLYYAQYESSLYFLVSHSDYILATLDDYHFSWQFVFFETQLITSNHNQSTTIGRLI